MTFDGCTFNSSGKTINVYTDFGAGKQDITVNFENCTVNNSGSKIKPVLNINDSNMGGYKYIINISGDNKINNTSADKDIFRDPVTCSRCSASAEKLEQIIQAKAWLLLTEILHSKMVRCVLTS